MKPSDFEYLCNFLRKTSGLVLTQEKSYLLDNRLQPLVRRHSLTSLDELIGQLRAGTRTGLDREIVEAMTTNESFFFRDNTPFENLRDVVLPKLLAARGLSRSIRIWCAAASTGQEPYSIAMIVLEAQDRLSGWNIEIVATDIDTEVLYRAKQGIYTQFEVQRGLPVQMLVKYFDKDGEKWQIHGSVREMVKYREHNLLKSAQGLGTFDIIFCRNVLIYFDQETKTAVFENMHKMLAEDGHLFLGGAETVLGVTERFKPMQGVRGVYEPVEAAAATAQPAVMAVGQSGSSLATG